MVMALSFEDSIKRAKAEAEAQMAVAAVANESIAVASVDLPSVMTLEAYGASTVGEDSLIAAYSGDDGNWTQDYDYTSYTTYVKYNDDDVSKIDDNKNIVLSKKQFNITQESNSQYIPFEMPRYYDGFDLAENTTISIHYVKKDGKHGVSEPVNVAFNDDRIRFAWLVDSNATNVAGELKFEIHAYGTAIDDTGVAHDYIWKSRPNKNLEVLESLCNNKDCDDVIVVDDGGWVHDIVTSVAEKVADQIANVSVAGQVAEAKDAALEARGHAEAAQQAASDAVEAGREAAREIIEVGGYVTEDVVNDAIADAIAEIDIEDQLVDYALKTDVGTMINQSTQDFATRDEVYAAIDSVDVSDQLGELGTAEDGSPLTVKEYVDAKVEDVDVSGQLGNLGINADGSDRTVVQYVQNELANIELDDYTTLEMHRSAVASINKDITELNDIIDAIDKSPNATYYTTYGESYISPEDGLEKDGTDTLVLYEVIGKGTPDAKETVVATHLITGGSGGSSSNIVLKIKQITPVNTVFTVDDKVEIEFDFTAVEKDEDNERDLGEGYFTWTLNDKTIVKNHRVKTGYHNVDLTEYFNRAVNDQKLTLIYSDGLSTRKQISWYVSIVDVRIASEFSDEKTYTAGKSIGFVYTPYGGVDKTIHFILDGDVENEVTELSSKNAATKETTYSIPAQNHGSHLFETYLTANISGKTVESNHIVKDFIWYDPNETTPVIGCAQQKFTTRQYDTTTITYSVYDPLSENPEVTLLSTYVDDNGEIVEEYNSSLTMTSNTGYWQYRSDIVGEHTLTITCRDVVKTLKATVEELKIDIMPNNEELAFDFNPTGGSNDDANRLWTYQSDTEGRIISMTVSDNFDWINGGYKIDDKKESYFCIKAGTTATIDYKMFCNSYNIKSLGGHYKLVFKTTKVQNADKPFMQCYKNNVGVIMKPQEANLYAGSGNHLYLAYSDDDIIEFELNMGESIKGSSDKMVMGYEDGVATKPLVYSDGATFIQGVTDDDAEYITLGSESCDLHIYRFKAYRRALSPTQIIDNFILDARNAPEILKRYDRNQIYEQGYEDVLTPEYLAEKCPDLRIIMLSAPTFTTDKDTKIGNTTIQCIYGNGRKVEDNWIAYDCVHSGQGTSSNLYGAAGRNLDLIMQPYKDYGNKPYIVLNDDDGTQVSEISLTESSVPTNYLNIKVNIASSENANNALLANRYNKFNPYKRPFVRDDEYPYDIKDTMEFQNCVVFIQETDETQDENGNYINHVEFNDTDWHFYAIGNIGDSKKTDGTRMNDPDDVNEFVIEIMDNNLPNSKFQSGVEDEKGYSITGKEVKELWQTFKDKTFASKEEMYSAVTDSKYLLNENLPIFYELIDGDYVLTSDESVVDGKTYYEINYPNTAYSGLYKDKYYRNAEGKVNLESGWGISFECRYEHDDSDHDEHRRIWNEFYEFVIFSDDTTFKNKLSDYCVLNSVMFYYLFTLRYTMIDNRAKNSFWHYGKCEDGIYRFDLTMDYDNDTSLGIDNFGKQVYRYGYEDIDYIDSNLEDVGAESRTWVFNAATSTFYKRLRDLFGAEISNLYNEIGDKNKSAWNAEDLITQWDNSQSQFPEELWRKDIERKYIRTYTSAYKDDTTKADQSFLKEKMNGRKKYHRRQFERNQEKYMASKFRTTDAKNDIIRMRAKKPSGNLAVPANFDITVTPYAYMYISVDYGNGNAVLQERAVPNVPITLEYPLGDNGDIIAIESASNLTSVGDLSPLYIEEGAFESAIRLKDLILGNETNGYSNTALLNVNMVKDGLLEVLNIENIPSLDDELNLSSLRNLRTVKAKGSGIQGLTLAENGMVETLSLPERLGILSMKNLHYMNDVDIESFDSLERLIIEDCDFSTIDNFIIGDKRYEHPNEISIIDNAPNLMRIRLTGINWNLSDVSLLERLYSSSIGGYDANGGEIVHSVLAGYVYVPTIKESQYDAYKAKWPNLEIGYGDKEEQHEVTFINDDGTILEIQYVDNNMYAIDPVTREVNPIKIPEKESTVSTEYTYAGWDTNLETTRIDSPRTVKATYTSKTREYTIKYVVDIDGVIDVKQETKAPYGTNVEYTGEIPTYTKGETIGATHFYLFDRWDESGIVDGEGKIVRAIFDDCKYVGGYFEDKELSDMSPVEVYAMMRLVEMKVLSCDGETISGTNIEAGDDFSFSMGYDVNYADIDSIEIISDKTVFDGTNYVDTGIKLFDEDRDFVLALDYKISSEQPEGSVSPTLMQCFDADGSNGFILSYGSNNKFTWGEFDITPSSPNNREMLVIRHKAGDNNLYVYTSNISNNSLEPYVIEKSRTTQSANATLVFGASKAPSGRFLDWCIGDINWCKIWYMDLGEEVCEKLSSWTHEKVTLEVSGFNRYSLYDDSTKESTMSLLATHLLDRKMKYNNKSGANAASGGWAESELNSLLNNRFYNSIPSQIKSLIKNVSVSSHIGNGTNTTSTSGCYVTIPSAYDVDANRTLYANELYAYNRKPIEFMSSNQNRIRSHANGDIADYWLRSPDTENAENRYVLYVDCDGNGNSNVPNTQNAGQVTSFMAPNKEFGVLIEISL